MNIRQEFPADVIEEAHYLIDNAARLPDCDERIRRDLRGLRSYAIDEKGTEDVDDAVSIEYLEDGREKIWIHIADVSRWVQPGSALSIEAERRMMTVYMPDERISMFPYVLATELLSLSAQSDSCALSCGITMDESGQVASYEVCPTKIKLTKQLTYKQVDLLLNEADPICFITDDVDDAKEMSRDIQRLFHWACVRQRYRLDQQGALSRYVSCRTNLNLIVKKDASKKPPKHTIIPLFSWSNASSINLVSEYMILMADTVGQMSITNDVPVWYKVQATDPPLTEDLLQLRPDETPYLRSCRLLRHLRGALDSKAPGPHATTGSSHYVQCTSPIRRYHDLYNHYRLKASMHAASMGKVMGCYEPLSECYDMHMGQFPYLLPSF
jgi:exoribonuclease-2